MHIATIAVLLFTLLVTSSLADGAKKVSAKTKGTKKGGAAKLSASEKAEHDLKAALKAATSGSKKIAIQRLKRAIDAAKEFDTLSSMRIEAEETISKLSNEDVAHQSTRKNLAEALQGTDISAIRQSLKSAQDAGLRGADLKEAEDRIKQLEKEQKQKEKSEAARRKAADALLGLMGSSTSAASLHSAITMARAKGVDAKTIADAETRLKEVEWQEMPMSERLEITSAQFGKEHCEPAKEVHVTAQCSLSITDLLERSSSIGEESCNHPTLRPGGPTPSMPNAVPAETSRHFCKYPPPFDLAPAEDGQGYKVAEFKFPYEYQHVVSEVKQLGTAVLNLDMLLFREVVEPCATKDVWLIEFYLHWCPHCQAFMPKFYKLAVAAKAAEVQLRFAAVNCASSGDLCRILQVIGHPLITLLYKGRDVRVLSALRSLEQNRPPSLSNQQQKIPDHLWPAEMAVDLIRVLPEEYRPPEAALKSLQGDGEQHKLATACPEQRILRLHRRQLAVEAEDHKQDGQSNAGGHLDGSEVEDRDGPSIENSPKSSVAAMSPVEEKNESFPNGTSPSIEQGLGENQGSEIEGFDDSPWNVSGPFPGNGWPGNEPLFTPEHRFQDAAQALVHGLEEWIMPDAAGQSPHAFSYLQVSDMHAWLSLVSRSFPATFQLNLTNSLLQLSDQLASLKHVIEESNGKFALCVEEWRQWVSPVRTAFDVALASRTLPSTCHSETCRLWTLLHTLSVAALTVEGSVPTTSVDGSFDAMIAYIRRYFTCRSCRQHFLEQVEVGAHDLSAARHGSARDLAMWWWRLHTAVSERVAREGSCKADRRWPPPDVCINCWQPGQHGDQAHLDEDEVTFELIRQYWPNSTGVTVTT